MSTFFQVYPIVCQTKLVSVILGTLALFKYLLDETYFAHWKGNSEKDDKNVSLTSVNLDRNSMGKKCLESCNLLRVYVNLYFFDISVLECWSLPVFTTMSTFYYLSLLFSNSKFISSNLITMTQDINKFWKQRGYS